MRIIKFLLISAVIVGVLGGIGLLVVREVMLIWGMSHLRTSVSKMRNISVNISPYVRECQKRGETDLTQEVIDKIQLKFTSDTEYQLELVCRQFQLDPIVVSSDTLPPLLTKAPGSSGLLWNEQLSSITLTIWGRERSLILEGSDVSYSNQRPNTPVGSGPVASCQGYGFSCCQAESTQGMGDQIPGVSDCARSCYSSCISRPIVLSFGSEPFFDPKTRSLTVAAGEPVTFSFVVDMGSAKTGTTTIEYGDGQSDTFSENTQTVDHQYVCRQAECQFTVGLRVTDSRGTFSAATPITQLTVSVISN